MPALDGATYVNDPFEFNVSVPPDGGVTNCTVIVPLVVSFDATPGARVGILAYGTSHWAIVESRDQLRREGALETSYLRLRAYPFSREVGAFIDSCDRVYVVEQNRDAQMLGLLRQELSAERIAKLRSVRHYNGLPIDARSVSDDILGQEGLAIVAHEDDDIAAGAVGGE